MREKIDIISGSASGHVVLRGDRSDRREFQRELWFDRDINGRWLVGVADQDQHQGDCRGAIIVKDPGVSQFIELLGELLCDPEKFSDEPVFEGPHRFGLNGT